MEIKTINFDEKTAAILHTTQEKLNNGKYSTMPLSRSAVVRLLIMKGVEQLEKEKEI